MYQRILLPNYKMCSFSHLSRVKSNSSVLLLLSKLELWPFLILIVQRAIKFLPIPLPAVSLRDLPGYFCDSNHNSLSANPKDYIHRFLFAKSLWDVVVSLSPQYK